MFLKLVLERIWEFKLCDCSVRFMLFFGIILVRVECTLFQLWVQLVTLGAMHRGWIVQSVILTNTGITFAFSSGEPIHWKDPLVYLHFGY